jgi:CRP-like cAMP-binding protein
MADKFWYLKNCDLFERLTPEQIDRLESGSKAKDFQRGGLIYLPSDESNSIFLLAAGRVKLHHITTEGKQAVLAIIDPGEIFGELAIFDGGQREEFAEAMEKSTVIMIAGKEVERLMEEHADVSLGITRLIGMRRRRIERRLKSLLFRSNRERLVHLLLELAEKYGQPTADDVPIGIKLSHQDLASIIGSTRETVTVLLGELQLEGLLKVRRRQIILSDVERLADSINVDAPEIKSGKEVGQRMLRQA